MRAILLDYRITEEDINSNGVVAAPDRLSGTSEANKRVFDRLVRVVVAQKLNAVLELLQSSTGAENIGASCGNIAQHIDSVSNPHGVTAQQIGAVTKDELDKALEAYMKTNDYKGKSPGVVSKSDFCTSAQNGIWTVRHSKVGNMHKLSGIPMTAGMYFGQFWATASMVVGDTIADARGNALVLANTGATFSEEDLVRVTVDMSLRKVWVG